MDKTLTHLGTLKGQLLLFGGVYSNYQALERLIQIAEEKGILPENCICTGDIVGYCAQPEETVALFRQWGAQSISGNVEQQLFEDAEDCGCDFTEGSRCDGFSKLWYPYSQMNLSEDSKQWMGKLPKHLTFTFGGEQVMVIHGSYNNVSEFIFKSTPDSSKSAIFELTQSNIIIAGHCGLPFHQKIEERLWLNPGVIGMPANEGETRVWYMVLEEISGRIEISHQYFEYDHKTANQLMIKNHLPEAYADTLLTGFWDNMEILPLVERQLRGITYNFGAHKDQTKHTITQKTK